MPKSIEKREKLTLKANQRKENYENNIKVEISLISKIYSRVPVLIRTLKVKITPKLRRDLKYSR